MLHERRSSHVFDHTTLHAHITPCRTLLAGLLMLGSASANRALLPRARASPFTYKPLYQSTFRLRRGRCAQVTPCRSGNAGLLTSGAVFAYSAMLLWGALSSEPVDDVCVLHSGTGNTGLRVRAYPAAPAPRST